MGTGTPSFGLRSRGKTHIQCRRCGSHSYHLTKKSCASCGFGNSSKLRKFSWMHRKSRL